MYCQEIPPFWSLVDSHCGMIRLKAKRKMEEKPCSIGGECSLVWKSDGNKQHQGRTKSCEHRAPGDQGPMMSNVWLFPGSLSINSLPQEMQLNVIFIPIYFNSNKVEILIKTKNFFRSGPAQTLFSSDTAPQYSDTYIINSVLPSTPESLKCGRIGPRPTL